MNNINLTLFILIFKSCDKETFTPLNRNLAYDYKVDHNIYIHTYENVNDCAILFDPVIKSGIYRFEVLDINKLVGNL